MDEPTRDIIGSNTSSRVTVILASISDAVDYFCPALVFRQLVMETTMLGGSYVSARQTETGRRSGSSPNIKNGVGVERGMLITLQI